MNIKRLFLSTILIIILSVLFFIEPIAQDLNYHNFADSRTIYSVSNFWNVVSNIPYFLVGLYAFYKMYWIKSLKIINEVKVTYFLLFLGVTLVAFGSGYYHLDPNNETLLWDRLPMSIAFMGLFSLVISEFYSIKLGKALIYPLVVAGVSSVVYWYVGELNGDGDLRFYLLVQFLPILLMPIIFIFFKGSFTLTRGYWWLLFFYILAKIFEYFDKEVFELLQIISGHSLKHIISAIGLWILVIVFEKRVRV